MLTGADAIVDGLSRVRRCTFEGRASMSFDLSHLERAVSNGSDAPHFLEAHVTCHTWGERSALCHGEVLAANALLCVRSLLTQIRALAPPGFSGSFRSADAYIKAFYLPWEELSRCGAAEHRQQVATVNGDKCDALSRCGICG